MALGGKLSQLLLTTYWRQELEAKWETGEEAFVGETADRICRTLTNLTSTPHYWTAWKAVKATRNSLSRRNAREGIADDSGNWHEEFNQIWSALTTERLPDVADRPMSLHWTVEFDTLLADAQQRSAHSNAIAALADILQRLQAGRTITFSEDMQQVGAKYELAPLMAKLFWQAICDLLDSADAERDEQETTSMEPTLRAFIARILSSYCVVG